MRPGGSARPAPRDASPIGRRWGRCGRWPGWTAREPCSYLLNPEQNFVPEPMEFGYERTLGHHALSFTCRDELGRLMEMVVMRDGGRFDLLVC